MKTLHVFWKQMTRLYDRDGCESLSKFCFSPECSRGTQTVGFPYLDSLLVDDVQSKMFSLLQAFPIVISLKCFQSNWDEKGNCRSNAIDSLKSTATVTNHNVKKWVGWEKGAFSPTRETNVTISFVLIFLCSRFLHSSQTQYLRRT